MRVATITALVRLANVGNERLGVLELALQRSDQCVLRVDRACRGACPEFQADCIRRHGSFLKVPGSKRTPIGVRSHVGGQYRRQAALDPDWLRLNHGPQSNQAYCTTDERGCQRVLTGWLPT